MTVEILARRDGACGRAEKGGGGGHMPVSRSEFDPGSVHSHTIIVGA